ncbi:MAG TPA: hypothetical protein VIU62_13580 [Chloroflexota bacterium]
MAQQVTIIAEMADGSHVVEHTEAFGEYVGMVLGFRWDPECVRLEWHPTPEPPEPVLYETSGACPWNRSSALDFELAEAAYQRWAPVA